MKLTRRHLQITLGLLWLVDGLLQLQPFMFTPDFAHQVLAPAGNGQPGWVAWPVRVVAGQFAQHPVLLNSAAAAIQFALGAGFLLRRAVHVAVVASIGWSVGLWWFGEGLGGLGSAHATLITGAPGAAILYGLLAAGSTPHDRIGYLSQTDRAAAWLTWAWASIWVGGAALQLLPAQNRATDLATQIRGHADGAPAWIAGVDRTAATLIARAGPDGLVLTAALMAVIGVGGLLPDRTRTVAIYTGATLAAVFWLAGQNLGQLYSGEATDPNSALLLIVLAAAISTVVPALTYSVDGHPNPSTPPHRRRKEPRSPAPRRPEPVRP